MIARILVGIVFATMAIGFIWFFAQVLYLGVREFFKVHGRTKTAKSTSKTISGPTTP